MEEYDDGDFTVPDDWDFTIPDDENDPWVREIKAAFAMDTDRWAEEDNKASLLQSIAQAFKGKEAYLSACERFVELFEQAGPEVLRGFYDDLDEIVSTFLVKRGVSVLLDTDKTLNIYSRIFDGPYQQAKRYARGIQWKSM